MTSLNETVRVQHGGTNGVSQGNTGIGEPLGLTIIVDDQRVTTTALGTETASLQGSSAVPRHVSSAEEMLFTTKIRPGGALWSAFDSNAHRTITDTDFIDLALAHGDSSKKFGRELGKKIAQNRERKKKEKAKLVSNEVVVQQNDAFVLREDPSLPENTPAEVKPTHTGLNRRTVLKATGAGALLLATNVVTHLFSRGESENPDSDTVIAAQSSVADGAETTTLEPTEASVQAIVEQTPTPEPELPTVILWQDGLMGYLSHEELIALAQALHSKALYVYLETSHTNMDTVSMSPVIFVVAPDEGESLEDTSEYVQYLSPLVETTEENFTKIDDEKEPFASLPWYPTDTKEQARILIAEKPPQDTTDPENIKASILFDKKFVRISHDEENIPVLLEFRSNQTGQQAANRIRPAIENASYAAKSFRHFMEGNIYLLQRSGFIYKPVAEGVAFSSDVAALPEATRQATITEGVGATIYATEKQDRSNEVGFFENTLRSVVGELATDLPGTPSALDHDPEFYQAIFDAIDDTLGMEQRRLVTEDNYQNPDVVFGRLIASLSINTKGVNELFSDYTEVYALLSDPQREQLTKLYSAAFSVLKKISFTKEAIDSLFPDTSYMDSLNKKGVVPYEDTETLDYIAAHPPTPTVPSFTTEDYGGIPISGEYIPSGDVIFSTSTPSSYTP